MRLNQFKLKNAALAMSLIFLVLIAFSCAKKEGKDIPLTKVQNGDFLLDVYETGEIEAINSINVSSPNISWRYGNLKITQLVKDGSEVKAGDTLVVFDPSEVKKVVVEAESNLEISKAELEKMKAQHQSDLEELTADLKVNHIAQEISKLRFESAGYEANIKRKEIALNLEKANIALKRAEEQLENRKKIQIEELKQKELSITQDENRLEEAHITLEQLFLTSPSPGIAIINRNWSTNNKFQVGDQCWSGFPLIQLPDMSALKATVNINEVDISKIKKGLTVEIKPDAFSNKTYPGEVITVANLATNKDNNSSIKVFPVEILLKKSEEKILPGLTVSCRIIVDKIENVNYLPLEAVFNEGDKSYVYKKTGVNYEKTEVETGVTNTDHIVIINGLEKGDQVTLTNPFAEEKTEDKTTPTTENEQ